MCEGHAGQRDHRSTFPTARERRPPNPGQTLQTIGRDDFTAFMIPAQLLYGANVAVGTFE